jgi:diadenosine tetraphosphate (Ap4A) HIT family hydrolase
MLPERWRVVAETQHFLVMMGLGPLTPGYMLVITREHTSCCAGIRADRVEGFMALRDAVRATQQEVYGCSLFFEHGRSGSCVPEGSGEDHCYHAHMHFMPVRADLAAAVREDYPLVNRSEWPDLVDLYYSDGASPYILTQDNDTIAYAKVDGRLPRQYLRTKLATVLGMPHLGDWVAFPSYEVVKEGIRDVASTLRLHVRNL